MSAVDLLGSRSGRVLRIAAGAGLVGVGLRRGDTPGRALAAFGLVPLAAGAGDVCVLGPLVGGPLKGQAFREHRAQEKTSVPACSG